MIAAALLQSALIAAVPNCAHPAVSQMADRSAHGVQHAFQNGETRPLRLFWIDPQGRQVDQGVIAPGGLRSVQTFAGHTFKLVDPADRCRKVVRIGNVTAGTYVGTSRYRAVAVRAGWRVFVDRALDPGAAPASIALATIAAMLTEAEGALPQISLSRVRATPIFLHDHAGLGGMFHRDPNWLVAHGRTVEMLNGIEISDAGVFTETAKVQPGSILHELTHALYFRLSDEDRGEIDRAYRRAMEAGRYRAVKRPDGSVGDAYARSNAAEYFAEISEAYFSRNDFYPFTRSELAAHDPDGERLVAKLWR